MRTTSTAAAGRHSPNPMSALFAICIGARPRAHGHGCRRRVVPYTSFIIGVSIGSQRTDTTKLGSRLATVYDGSDIHCSSYSVNTQPRYPRSQSHCNRLKAIPSAFCQCKILYPYAAAPGGPVHTGRTGREYQAGLTSTWWLQGEVTALQFRAQLVLLCLTQAPLPREGQCPQLR